MIFFDFTFTDESLGKAVTSLGGKLSLGPPLGGSILAQEDDVTIHRIREKLNNKNESVRFIQLQIYNQEAFIK